MTGARPLVVSDPTLVVRLDGERLVLLRQGKRVGAVPMHELSQVVLQGPITLTGAARNALLERGVEITLLSSSGFFLGTTSSAAARNVFLMLAQVACWNDTPRRMQLARGWVASKIEGQRRLLLQHARNRDSESCSRAAAMLTSLLPSVAAATDEDELRGFEGTAAAAYFGAFGAMLSLPWLFPGRVRRPPTDPVNALLSYGYTLLTGRMALLLQARSFDLRVGMFHGLRYGRASLALDMIEEFRTPVVDRLMLRLLNRQQFGPQGFERDETTGGVRLSLPSRRLLFAAWEQHLTGSPDDTPAEPDEDDPLAVHVRRGGIVDDPGKRPRTWQQRMERQVLRLRRFLLKDHPYRPLLTPPEEPPDGTKS